MRAPTSEALAKVATVLSTWMLAPENGYAIVADGDSTSIHIPKKDWDTLREHLASALTEQAQDMKLFEQTLARQVREIERLKGIIHKEVASLVGEEDAVTLECGVAALRAQIRDIERATWEAAADKMHAEAIADHDEGYTVMDSALCMEEHFRARAAAQGGTP